MGNDIASEWDAQEQRSRLDEVKSRLSISITGARLWVIRIGALLCVGIVMAYYFDLFIAAPGHELALIKDKHTACGSKGRQYYVIHLYTRAWGGKDLERRVSLDYYDKCMPGDVLRLTVTPRFKFWHSGFLMRHGDSVDAPTITDTWGIFILGILSLIPSLTFVPRIAATQTAIFWFPVILFEAAGIVSFVFQHLLKM